MEGDRWDVACAEPPRFVVRRRREAHGRGEEAEAEAVEPGVGEEVADEEAAAPGGSDEPGGPAEQGEGADRDAGGRADPAPAAAGDGERHAEGPGGGADGAVAVIELSAPPRGGAQWGGHGRAGDSGPASQAVATSRPRLPRHGRRGHVSALSITFICETCLR